MDRHVGHLGSDGRVERRSSNVPIMVELSSGVKPLGIGNSDYDIGENPWPDYAERWLRLSNCIKRVHNGEVRISGHSTVLMTSSKL